MEKSCSISLVTLLICILTFVLGGQGTNNEACLYGFYCDGSQDPLLKSQCVDGVCVCSGEFVQNSCLPNVTDCAIEESSTSDSHPASVCTSISSTDICSKDFKTYHCFANTNPRYEVHVIGSHQATSCCSDVPEISKVRVVRHGDVQRKVVLVLTSTRPVSWYLDLENGIDIDQVILVCKTASLTTVSWSQQGSVQRISKLTNTTESQYDLYGKGGDSIKLLQYLSMNYGAVTSFTGRFQVNQWRLRIGWPASKTASQASLLPSGPQKTSIPLARSTIDASQRPGAPASSVVGHPRVTPSSPGIQPYSSVSSSVPDRANFIHSVPFFQVFGTMEFRHISGMDYYANGTLRVHRPASSEYVNIPLASTILTTTSTVSVATSSKSNVFSTIATVPSSASTVSSPGPHQVLSSTPALNALPSSTKLLVSSPIASSTQVNAKSSSVVPLRPCEVRNPCDQNALCSDTDGGTTCACKDGFKGTGLTCTDIDECTGLDPCPTFSECKNAVGSYECICEKPGFCRNTRLVALPQQYDGRVEVLHEGQWGSVCANGWDTKDTQVACRDAGYPYLVGTLLNIAVPDGIGKIWLSGLQCNGSETRLADCASPGFGNIDGRCRHQDDIGVSCQPTAVRLVGSDKPDEGRVEVYYDDEWGTICDEGWDLDDADVVCYELGFDIADRELVGGEAPDGQGKIWLENVTCTGLELDLRSCENQRVGKNSACDHSRDAGVKCSLKVPCDFELNTCSWRNVQEGDDFDWQRNRGSTPTLYTGPTIDNTLKSTFGTYVYIETSGRKPGQKATLVSSPMPISSNGCLSFYYHMKGSDIAQLNVNLREIGTSTVKRLWNLGGSKEDKWTEAKVPIISEKPFEIIFEAVSGQDQKGDIALDDIDFNNVSSCVIYPSNAAPDTDECKSKPCDTNATCTNTIGSYTCKCNKGYRGNGTDCADLDECATNPCHVNATCRNTAGSFSCTCNANTEGICDDAYRPCGLREIFRKAGSKIIGGKTAVKGSWPWQAAIMYTKNEHVSCGGVLVNQDYVLTAAHCFDSSVDTNDYTVILGEHDLLTQESDEQHFKVDDIIIHPNYIASENSFDIAILYLSALANYTANVLPICLSDTPFPTGTNCVITGWGTRTAQREDYPQFLQEAVVPTISHEVCKNLYSSQSVTISQDMLCAGYTTGTIDACQGDSGGPLVCQRGSKWYLAGLTSFGYQCAARGYPGVYANVVDLRFWIFAQIA